MQDMNQNKNDFVIEKIKERPINKKKLLRRTLITAFMAVMFGLIACVTFLLLEPVISNWLYPKEEPQVGFFPEEKDEMNPEEMLFDDTSEDEEIGIPGAVEGTQKNPQKEELYEWSMEDYAGIYEALGELTTELQEYMVTVVASKTSEDWLENITKSKTDAPGILIGNSGMELLILTDYGNVKNADTIMVRFYDGFEVQAQVKEKHTVSDLAIVAVNIVAMGERIDTVKLAPLGSSRVESLLATPVIALGEPVGERDSVCYGMITWESGEVNLTDASFSILTTDIYGNSNSSGFLFNLKGQLVGVITSKKPTTESRNMLTAYNISDLRRLISRLSNGYAIPYVGITGITVSEEAQKEDRVPQGIFVKTVDMNSPAMKAGIQPGDVIIEVNSKPIDQFKDYFNTLANMESNQTIKIRVMRLSVNEFKEMEFDIVVEKAE